MIQLKVTYRNEDGSLTQIRCSGIETYGGNMCFSDEYQDLIRVDGKILEVPTASLYSVKTK